MEPTLEQTTALLARTPAALNAPLRDLPESWTHQNEGPNTWMTRAKIILQHGQTRPFDRFDRTAFTQMPQDVSIGERLDEFARLRSANLDELQALHLRPADLEKRGRHPVLGLGTLSELLATWAAHDLTHLHQLSRAMAGQQREAVGPWIQVLGVLH